MNNTGVLVCLKWVSTRTEVHPISGEITTDERFSGISPADSSALEWALLLGAALGGSVTAATVGPEESEKTLRDAIACGAGRGVRFDASQSVPSEAAAAALSLLGADHQMIVCGDYSIDRGSGSVPAFIAHRLGLPQALGLIKLETSSGKIIGTRRLDQGRRERLALRLPTVVSVESGRELRRAALSSTLSATSATIEVRPMPEMLGVPASPVSLGVEPFRPRTRVIAAPSGNATSRVSELAQLHGQQSPARVVKADPERAADIAIAQLRDWGYL